MTRDWGWLVVLGSTVAGCNPSTPGGPGAAPPADSRTSNSTTPSDSSKTFTLTAPALATHVKPGESTEFSIAIQRGQNFTQDVTLTFSTVPDGITLVPASPTLKAADSDITIRLQAAETAVPGNYNIRLTGKPVTGADAQAELKITVDPKE